MNPTKNKIVVVNRE